MCCEDNWGIDASQSSFVNENYIRDRAQIANSYNKPIIMEEVRRCHAVLCLSTPLCL